MWRPARILPSWHDPRVKPQWYPGLLTRQGVPVKCSSHRNLSPGPVRWRYSTMPLEVLRFHRISRVPRSFHLWIRRQFRRPLDPNPLWALFLRVKAAGSSPRPLKVQRPLAPFHLKRRRKVRLLPNQGHLRKLCQFPPEWVHHKTRCAVFQNITLPIWRCSAGSRAP